MDMWHIMRVALLTCDVDVASCIYRHIQGVVQLRSSSGLVVVIASFDADASNNLDADVTAVTIPPGADRAYASVTYCRWCYVAAHQQSSCTVCLGRGVRTRSYQ
jgi:hypothetical protein